MAVNKVEFGGETLIDLTGDTVKSGVLLKGETAHGADGEPVEGAMVAVPTTTSLAVTEEGVSALDGTVGKVLNDKFGGCSFEQDGEDFYIVGADSVRKKLGSASGTLTIKCSYVVRVGYAQTAGNFGKNYGSTTISATITVIIENGLVQSSSFSGGTGNSQLISNTSGVQFRGEVSNFRIVSVQWKGIS